METPSKLLKSAREAGPLMSMIVLLGFILYGLYRIAANHLYHMQGSLNRLEINAGEVRTELRAGREEQVRQTDRIINALR